MDWLVFIGSSRRHDPVSWSPDAGKLFTEIAGELAGSPGIKIVTDTRRIRRPCIFAGRRLAVAGHDDGIAVRLEGERKQGALRVTGCRLLSRRDGLPVAGMVAVPWSAHEHWREMMRAALPP